MNLRLWDAYACAQGSSEAGSIVCNALVKKALHSQRIYAKVVPTGTLLENVTSYRDMRLQNILIRDQKSKILRWACCLAVQLATIVFVCLISFLMQLPNCPQVVSLIADLPGCNQKRVLVRR